MKSSQLAIWSWFGRLACAAAFLAAIAVLNGRAVAEGPLPDDVVKSLEQNAKAISPLTIKWEKTRSSDLSAVEVTRKLNFQIPERNINFLEPETVRLQWDGAKFHAYTTRRLVGLNDDLSPDELHDDALEQAFDTKRMFVGSGEQFSIDQLRPPTLGIRPFKAYNPLPDYFKDNEEAYWVSYFREAGYRLPNHFVLFGAEPKSAVVYLVENGWKVSDAAEAKLDDSTCLKVTIKKDREYVFYLDRAHNLAVRRREEFTPSGKLDVRADMSDFRQLPDSALWLPQRCDVDYFGWSPTGKQEPADTPLFHETFRVTELDNKPIDEKTFTLNYTVPGTRVGDATLIDSSSDQPEYVNYTIPKDPDDLPKVIEEAVKQARSRAKGTQKAK